jgi:4-amino-4-deoxy-L-arabinose transferase-like glycosyltransferase
LSSVTQNDAISRSETAGTKHSLPRTLLFLWLALVAIRAFAVFIGLDRLPLLPAEGDELIINDPAVALSRGHGLVAFSFEHSYHGLDHLYAHFPPLFIAWQALVFWLFGFTAFTLRVSSALFSLAAYVAVLGVLIRLWRDRLVDTVGIGIAGCILLLDPTTVHYVREARMDSLVVLLGVLAFYCAYVARQSAKRDRLLWVAASLLVGLAFCCHPSALVMWLPFAFWAWRTRNRLGLRLLLVLAAIPFITFASLWIGVYRSRVLDALRQLHQIASYAPAPSLRVSDFVDSLKRGSFVQFNHAGGIALIITLLCVVFGVCKLLAIRLKSPEQSYSRSYANLASLTAMPLSQLLLLEFVIPTSGNNRIMLALPFAILCLAVCLSYFAQRWRPRIAWMAGAVFAVQITMLSTYVLQIANEWSLRSPERFDALLREIPANAKVVAARQFWFAFNHQNRPVALMYHLLDEDVYWNNRSDAFNQYDVVILDPAAAGYSQLLEKARIGRPIYKTYHSFRRDFVVFAKKLVTEPNSSSQNQ